jgi:hypothetical protein
MVSTCGTLLVGQGRERSAEVIFHRHCVISGQSSLPQKQKYTKLNQQSCDDAALSSSPLFCIL